MNKLAFLTFGASMLLLLPVAISATGFYMVSSILEMLSSIGAGF